MSHNLPVRPAAAPATRSETFAEAAKKGPPPDEATNLVIYNSADGDAIIRAINRRKLTDTFVEPLGIVGTIPTGGKLTACLVTLSEWGQLKAKFTTELRVLHKGKPCWASAYGPLPLTPAPQAQQAVKVAISNNTPAAPARPSGTATRPTASTHTATTRSAPPTTASPLKPPTSSTTTPRKPPTTAATRASAPRTRTSVLRTQASAQKTETTDPNRQ